MNKYRREILPRSFLNLLKLEAKLIIILLDMLNYTVLKSVEVTSNNSQFYTMD